MKRFGDGKVDQLTKVVAVTEILDTERFVGTWKGQSYECRAIPDTGSLSVGDGVVCHVLPGTTELVAVFRANEVLFFCPGTVDDVFDSRTTLYKLASPTGTPELVWTTLDPTHYITALAWTALTSKLYVFVTVEGVPDPRYTGKIYEYDVAAETMTEVWSGETGDDAMIDVAEFGGYLYVHCSGYAWNNNLYRFDPVVYTMTAVNSSVGGVGAWWNGGGVAVTNGTIVHCDGTHLFASASGDPGSFAQVADLSTGWFQQMGANSLVTNSADGKIYLSGGHCYDSDTPVNVHSPIYSWDGTTLTLEYEVVEPVGGDEWYFGGLGLRYNGMVPTDIIAAKRKRWLYD